MKKNLILFFLFVFALKSCGQTLQSIPLQSLDVKYMQIIGMERTIGQKTKVRFDLGSEKYQFEKDEVVLTDKKGKILEFTSMIDALNYMCKHGWELKSAYGFTEGADRIHHYILEKVE